MDIINLDGQCPSRFIICTTYSMLASMFNIINMKMLNVDTHIEYVEQKCKIDVYKIYIESA